METELGLMQVQILIQCGALILHCVFESALDPFPIQKIDPAIPSSGQRIGGQVGASLRNAGVYGWALSDESRGDKKPEYLHSKTRSEW